MEKDSGTSIKDIEYYVDKNYSSLTVEESMIFNSLFLSRISKCHPSLRMILNSSQQIEDKFIVNWNDCTPLNQLFCLDMRRSGNENNLRISYMKLLHREYFQIQIYHIFLF